MTESRFCLVAPQAMRFRTWTPEHVVAECLVWRLMLACKTNKFPGSRSWYLWRYCIAGDKEGSGIAESTERRHAVAYSSGKVCEEPEDIVAYCVMRMIMSNHVSCVASILTSLASSRKSFLSTANSCSCERPVCIPYFRTATAIVP